jgi:replicative DNA helicase
MLPGTDRHFEKPRPKVQAIDVAGRVPPHDLDAEACVLSAILMDSRALDAVLEILPTGKPFYSDAHGRIFDCAVDLHARGQPVDIQTVASLLKDKNRLTAVGGIAYLARIVDVTPAVAHVGAHARIVKEKWRLRTLIETCFEVAAEGLGEITDTQQFIDAAEQRVYDIARTPAQSSVTQIYDVVTAAFEQLQQSMDRGKTVTGCPSGFGDLDEMTSGMHDGELIVVAARPGMGKTSFVLNIATNVASMIPQPLEEGSDICEPRLGVMIFSLEMPKEQLANRMMCSEGRVGLSDLRKGQVHDQKWDALVEAAGRLSQMSIWIDDTPAINILELRARIRRQQADFDRTYPDGKVRQRVGLIIIDYMQLMRGRENAQSREQEISEISRGLKALAKELSVPVIALSQLNRAVETRSTKDKRPQLSDLRESGAIEQDADMVQFIYRPEVYADRDSADAQKLKGYSEIIIAKQRNGPTGKVALTYTSEYTRFDNRAKDAWRDGDD